MLAFLEKILARAPGWAIGIALIIIALAWGWTQVQAHRANKDRDNLWMYSKAVAETVDVNAQAATNPTSMPAFVEEKLPPDWVEKK